MNFHQYLRRQRSPPFPMSNEIAVDLSSLFFYAMALFSSDNCVIHIGFGNIMMLYYSSFRASQRPRFFILLFPWLHEEWIRDITRRRNEHRKDKSWEITKSITILPRTWMDDHFDQPTRSIPSSAGSSSTHVASSLFIHPINDWLFYFSSYRRPDLHRWHDSFLP